jgi:hypothetical protein
MCVVLPCVRWKSAAALPQQGQQKAADLTPCSKTHTLQFYAVVTTMVSVATAAAAQVEHHKQLSWM